MNRRKLDGLVEAVRYKRNGKIDQVRAYKRRGATFTDRVIMDRAELLGQLHQGKRYATGVRRELWANSFQVDSDIILSPMGEGTIFTKGLSGDQDLLAGIPLF